MFSSFSRSQESKEDLKSHFGKALALVAIISFPIYAGLIVVAPYFVYCLLGEKWAPMILPFQIILFGFCIKCFGGLIASLIVGIGKYRSLTVRLLVAGVIFAISCYLLLPFGITGVAFGFVFFCITEFGLGMSLSLRSIGVPWRYFTTQILPALRGALIMFLVVGIASLLVFKEYSIPNMGVLVMMGGGVYIVCLWLDRINIVKELRDEIVNDLKRYGKLLWDAR